MPSSELKFIAFDKAERLFQTRHDYMPVRSRVQINGYLACRAYHAFKIRAVACRRT